MRIVILTSSSRGTACRVLSVLRKNPNIEIAKVVLATGPSGSRRRRFCRALKNVHKIGILGALNGIRIRRWYRDDNTPELISLCKELGIDTVSTACINCKETRAAFRDSNADLGLSLGNSYIGKIIFSIPRDGMLNLHTEILPEYQGAQSVIWPIFHRRVETGFTIHQIGQHIDTGDIIYQERFKMRLSTSLEKPSTTIVM